MDPAFLERSVNEGFSGGEEAWSLDRSARPGGYPMKLIQAWISMPCASAGVNQLATADNATLLITHYQRLLDEITPDYVHVMAAGRILRTGGRELALELEETGYDWVDQELAAQGVA